MKDNHIIDILESRPFANLSESEQAEIRSHIATCLHCRQAFEATRVSALLLREGANEVFDPSPFFHTRILAALRERQSEATGFKRLWQSSGALVSSMAATVTLLAVLSFLLPSTQSLTATQAPLAGGYSAEEVILYESDLAEEEASDAQVLSSLYAVDEEAMR
jgi:anti-sigma factor RsiW